MLLFLFEGTVRAPSADKELELLAVTDWLINGPPWLSYRTLIDLQHTPLESEAAKMALLNLSKDPQVVKLITELANWPGPALKRHNDAGHSLHKLVFLADLGLPEDDRSINKIVQRVLQHQSGQGAFQIIVNVAPAFGGSGQDTCGWALCDTPSVLYSLFKDGPWSGCQSAKSSPTFGCLEYRNRLAVCGIT